jgi:hypothetical protein
LFNLHVAMCDNDNVVTDEVKLRLKHVLRVRVWNLTMLRTYDCEY